MKPSTASRNHACGSPCPARPLARATSALAYGDGWASAHAAMVSMVGAGSSPHASWDSTSMLSNGMHALLPGSAFCTAWRSRSSARAFSPRARCSARPRPDRLVIALALEQHGRLVVPALLDPQVGQPDERAGLEGAPAQRPEPHRLGQCLVGLRPASGRGEDAAVVGAAVGAHGGEVPALRDLFTHTDPLFGSRHVAGLLAGGEHLAEDLLHDDEVLDVAARNRGQCLVQQRASLPRCDRRAPGSRRGRRASRTSGPRPASADRSRQPAGRLPPSSRGWARTSLR